MDALLIALMFVAGMVAGLAALVHFARHDGFAGPGTGYRRSDELSPPGQRRRAA